MANRMERRAIVLFCIVLLVLCSVELAVAQDAEADFESALFAGSGADETQDSPDPVDAAAPMVSGFAASAASTDVARIDRLIGGTVAADATAIASRAPDAFIATSDISGKLFAKVTVPDYGSLYVAYNATHAFFQSYTGDGTPPPAADPYDTSFELSELHYSFDIAKRLFVRIGNQLVAWGPSRIWTPVDFINLEKADSFADVDLRVGKPGLRLHLLLPSSNAFLFADFSSLSEDGSYGDSAEKVNLGGRLDTTWRGFEYGLTGYGGANEQARFGADFSGRLLGTTVYGELALAGAYGSYDSLVQAALGFSRALDELKRWTLSAEAFFNSRGRDLSGYSVADLSALSGDERVPLYQGSYYAYVSLAADELFSTYLTTALSAISNLEDRSYSVKLSETAAFPRAVPFTFSLSYAGGGDDKEFTRYAGDGSVSLSLSTKIAF